MSQEAFDRAIQALDAIMAELGLTPMDYKTHLLENNRLAESKAYSLLTSGIIDTGTYREILGYLEDERDDLQYLR